MRRKGWSGEVSSDKCYFDRLYLFDGDDSPMVVIRVKGKWYISSSATSSVKEDVGPYRCLLDAQIALETMVVLNEIPKHLEVDKT